MPSTAEAAQSDQAPRPGKAGRHSTAAAAKLRVVSARLSAVPLWQALAALFAFAFFVRVAYLLEIKDTLFFQTLVGDGFAYDRRAVEIAQDWIGKEVFYQAPLYSYFLAGVYGVFGHDTVALRLVQMTLGSAACVLLTLGGRSFFSARVAAIAGLLLAVYAPAIFFDGIVQKASLDLFLVTALIFFLGKIEDGGPRYVALIAGLTLGCLSLTRENALVLIPGILLWLGGRYWRERRERHLGQLVALYALGIGLTLGPVALRNYAVGHEFVLTTSQFGANFYIGNNESADGMYDPLQWGHGSYPLERQDAFDIAEHAAGRELTPREVARYWTDRAFSWVRSHPLQWLKLMGRKWLLVWNGREIADSDEPLVYRDASWTLTLAASVFVFGTLCPLAVVGVAATWSQRGRLAILYLIALGIALGTTVFFVFARYRFPMTPVLLLFAASGMVEIVRLAKERRVRALAGRLLLLGAAACVVGLDLGGVGNPRAMAYYNLAVSLEQQGLPGPAASSYQRAIDHQSDFVQAHVNLGALFARGGAFEEAIAQEKSALAVRPDDAIAHTNLANALLELGHFDEAEVHYRAAVKIQPDLVQAQDGLSVLLNFRKERLAK